MRATRTRPVQDVELHEVVGEAVIEAGVPGVQPLALEDVAGAEDVVEIDLVDAGPLLEEVEMALPRAAGEEMAAAFQQQTAGVEAQAGVGAVHLLLYDAEPASQLPERNCVEVMVAVVEPRALQVRSARTPGEKAFHWAGIEAW
jgi:hypothetical protein